MPLLAFLVRSFVVTLAAEMLLFALRRRSASVRHLVASISLISVVLLGVGALVAQDRPTARFTTQIVVENTLVVSAVQPQPRKAAPALQPMTPVPVDSPSEPFPVLQTIWLAGSALLAGRFLVAIIALRLRVEGIKKVDGEFETPLFTDPMTPLPLTTWWGRSMILLPAGWTQWPPEKLDVVLKHEQGHVQRHDWWFQLAANLACIVSWPNPLVWLLKRQALDLSEEAVDDRVLSSGVPASRYAQDLLQIAVHTGYRIDSLSMPMALKPQVSRRIEMLLKAKKERGVASLIAIASLSACFLVLTAGASMWSIVGKHRHSVKTETKQYLIKSEWYSLDYRPDVLKSAFPRQPLSNLKGPFPFTLSTDNQVKDLVERCGGRLTSSPVLRTLDDAPATIYCIVASDPKNPKTNHEYREEISMGKGEPMYYSAKVIANAAPHEWDTKLSAAENASVWDPRAPHIFSIYARPSAPSQTFYQLKNCPLCPPDGKKQVLIVHTFEQVVQG